MRKEPGPLWKGFWTVVFACICFSLPGYLLYSCISKMPSREQITLKKECDRYCSELYAKYVDPIMNRERLTEDEVSRIVAYGQEQGLSREEIGRQVGDLIKNEALSGIERATPFMKKIEEVRKQCYKEKGVKEETLKYFSDAKERLVAR